eukprot:CAMPEP_0197436528 /NCGR_PEP_ID=MMETSP1175-20131217/3967_1 /TAXON_ID=1003142 /ORGANISM="Triceratium dubium, Strain CCMP147" /LENGTH=961 /DNA_ID=CAMNT_0042965837 /DNA_START=69 /DNA_END=2954 /DNA_ORIENTATION=-
MMKATDMNESVPVSERTRTTEQLTERFRRRRLTSSEPNFVTVDVDDDAESFDIKRGSDGSSSPSSLSDSLRDQSRRLSLLLTRRTELYRGVEPTSTTPDPKDCGKNDSSGWNHWVNEVRLCSSHGGDYRERSRTALRTAVGSFLTFSLLVFPRQQVLGAVWIGNIFMHSNMKGSFGASLLSVWGFGQSAVLITAASWPVGNFVSSLSETQASIILPFVSFLMSFLIMTCPQLTSRNLMILVMYIVVAAPVREDIQWWMPIGYLGTYLIGMIIALLMNSANFALRSTHSNLESLEKDLTMLLNQCKAYSTNLVIAPDVSRAAAASIEMLYTRIADTVKCLKAELAASKVELLLQFKSKAANDLSEWIVAAEQLLAPLKSLRTALMQRVIGEERTVHDRTTATKEIIDHEIAPARDRMVDAMLSSIAVCHAWADPSAHRTVLPDVQGELAISIEECRRAFHQAMRKATAELKGDAEENVPVFAHLTRRTTAFNALFEFGDSLLAYLEEHSWEAEEAFDENKNETRPRTPVCHAIGSFVKFVELKWLWHQPDTFRLALKTAVGMSLASLFVSVPVLWNISEPFGIWPGLTIASVNLGTTGSSFQKAADRLSGTLLAAAYALLLSDLFPGNTDAVKVPGIAIFTFLTIYLRSDEHAYMYTYAATSIGSMLYGSVKNDFNIPEYIPKRIELIFVGVVIFSVVELLMFPRSSRKMVECLGFQFFLSVRDYLKQAARCARRMQEYVAYSVDDTMHAEALFDEADDTFHLEQLDQCHRKLKTESSKLKKELEPALNEPHLGLSMPLQRESFRGLAKELNDCETQAFLLLKAFRKLSGYYHEVGHPIREVKWPHTHARFLEDASVKTSDACEWLKAAYPDGQLRAQEGNSVKAVIAAAAFRSLLDVRLRTMSVWTNNYSDFIHRKGLEDSDPMGIMTLGITTTFILELCRHLEKAGRHVEHIAHKFPSLK